MNKLILTLLLALVLPLSLGAQGLGGEPYQLPGTNPFDDPLGIGTSTTGGTTGPNTAGTLPNITPSTLDYRMLEPLPFTAKGTDAQGRVVTDLPTYLTGLYKLALVMGTVLAIFMIIVGGFKYLTSVIPNVKLDGKQDINNALIGLAWLFGAVLLVEIINPSLTTFSKNIIPSLAIKSIPLNAGRLTSTQYIQAIGQINAEIAAKQQEYNNATTDEQKAFIKEKLDELYIQKGTFTLAFNLRDTLLKYNTEIWNLSEAQFNTEAKLNPALTAQQALLESPGSNLSIGITDGLRDGRQRNLPALQTMATETRTARDNLSKFINESRKIMLPDLSTPRIPAETFRNTRLQKLSTLVQTEIGKSQTIHDENVRAIYGEVINKVNVDLQTRINASRDAQLELDRQLQEQRQNGLPNLPSTTDVGAGIHTP